MAVAPGGGLARTRRPARPTARCARRGPQAYERRAASAHGQRLVADDSRACRRPAGVWRRFDAGLVHRLAQQHTGQSVRGAAGRRPHRNACQRQPFRRAVSARRQRNRHRSVRCSVAGLVAPQLVEPGLAKRAGLEQQRAGVQRPGAAARFGVDIGVALARLARPMELRCIHRADRRREPAGAPFSDRQPLHAAAVFEPRDRADAHDAVGAAGAARTRRAAS